MSKAKMFRGREEGKEQGKEKEKVHGPTELLQLRVGALGKGLELPATYSSDWSPTLVSEASRGV